MDTLCWKYFEKDWGDQKVWKVCLSNTEQSRALSLYGTFLPSNLVLQAPRRPLCSWTPNTPNVSSFQALAYHIPPDCHPFPGSLVGWLYLVLQATSQLFPLPSCLPHLFHIYIGSLPNWMPLGSFTPFISLIALTSICDFHEDRELACLVFHCNPGA